MSHTTRCNVFLGGRGSRACPIIIHNKLNMNTRLNNVVTKVKSYWDSVMLLSMILFFFHIFLYNMMIQMLRYLLTIMTYLKKDKMNWKRIFKKWQAWKRSITNDKIDGIMSCLSIMFGGGCLMSFSFLRFHYLFIYFWTR
jgi:hypothetical protein